MPVNIDDFVRIIERIAPKELAYDWDNSGLLLRCGDTVSRVLVALDATLEVAEEAVREGCDMLLVHHPLIFSPVRSLSHKNPTDAVLMRLIRAGISLYAAHTTFDRAQGGINDALAQKLGLADLRTIPGPGEELLRIGRLPGEMSRDGFVSHVKTALGLKALRVSQSSCETVSCVGVAGGSGGDFIAAAKKEGAQALVTGEAKHHHHIEAVAQGLLLIEAGHFETEYVFVDRIFMSLQAALNEVQLDLVLKKTKCEKVPYAVR